LSHRTSCTGLRGILSCGEIRPNDGSFRFSFARSKTSYGFHHGYISLFDFQDTSVADQIRTFVIWNNLIGQVGKIFFLLVLDSSKLRTDLISSCSAPQPGQPNYGGCMRPIECWYPRPIRLDLVRDVIVVSHCAANRRLSLKRIYDSRNLGSSLFLAVLLCSDAEPAACTVAANYAAR
jgi:hypothetical protein